MKYFTTLARYYDMQFTESKYEKEAKFIEEMVRKYHPGSPRNILDLMCGTGRHAIYLSKNGFAVTGIDNSSEMLEIAQQRALERQLKISFELKDVRNMEYQNRYDAVYCWFNSFEYLYSNDDVVTTLQNVHKSLKKNGVFLVDIRNGSYYLLHKPNVPFSGIIEKPDIKLLITISNVYFDTKEQIMVMQYNFFIQEKNKIRIEHEDHKYRLFHPLEFQYLLRSNGFKILEIYGSNSDANKNFTKDSSQMVFVAAKR
ncbi:MAG: class I SAM-dependent DNA methyltransferase [Candidatus Cloacimonadia bacterium]